MSNTDRTPDHNELADAIADGHRRVFIDSPADAPHVMAVTMCARCSGSWPCLSVRTADVLRADVVYREKVNALIAVAVQVDAFHDRKCGPHCPAHGAVAAAVAAVREAEHE